jgi:hypothetical protein
MGIVINSDGFGCFSVDGRSTLPTSENALLENRLALQCLTINRPSGSFGKAACLVSNLGHCSLNLLGL